MTLAKKGYRPRIADIRLSKMLDVFGAVCVEGPKYCGKTWTSLNHANSAFFVSDPTENFLNRSLVSSNVEFAFRDAKSPHLIDEWQEFPSIWDATRMKVDENGREGQYILTGSSTPTVKGVLHSGAGRIGNLTMRTMSLFESGDSDGAVSLSSLFEGEDVFTEIRKVERQHIVDLTIRGGWPGLIGKDPESASTMNRDYVSKIIKEASVLDGRRRDLGKMDAFFRSLARNESTVVSNTTLATDMEKYDDESMSEQTVSEYLDVLSRMFMINDQPSFSTNFRSPVRVGKKPKKHLADPSLAAAAMGLDRDRLMRDPRTFGYLFESLCIRDLDIYASAIGGSVRHYRDSNGHEVDAIVENGDGRWGMFEVRTGTEGIEDGVRSLRRAEKVYIDQGWPLPEFLCVICGTASAAYRRQDGVYVVPITSLRYRCIRLQRRIE